VGEGEQARTGRLTTMLLAGGSKAVPFEAIAKVLNGVEIHHVKEVHGTQYEVKTFPTALRHARISGAAPRAELRGSPR